MPSNEEDLSDGPPSATNPYEVLGLEPSATAEQVKSAYRKRALKHHPDKAAPEAKDEAHKQFQKIAFAYAILCDPKRRSRYDNTGNTSESFDLDDDDFSWTDFFRAQKAETVDGNAVQKIKDEYQRSDEEKADLLLSFEKYEGDMDLVYAEVMCSNVLEDDERFRQMIDDAISAGEVTAWRKYKKETAVRKRKRVEKAKKEEIEARKYAEELGVADKLFGSGAGKRKRKKDDTADLTALIQQRQKNRGDALLDSLVAKYSGEEKKSEKGKKQTISNVDEPPEEAFARNRIKRAHT